MNSWKAFFVAGTAISFVVSLILLYTKSIVATSLITGGGVIIAGVIGFFVWKYLENDVKKIIIQNNIEIIKEFFNYIFKFANYGKEILYGYNLFVIAIEKENDIIKDICLFPHFIEALNSSDICPSFGKNSQGDSNSSYYYLLLNGIKVYITKYLNRVHNHLNILFDFNLMKDFQKDIDFLKNANPNEIIKEIEKIEKGENSIKTINPFESSTENENDFPFDNTNVDIPTIQNNNLNEEKEKRNKNYSKKKIMNYN